MKLTNREKLQDKLAQLGKLAAQAKCLPPRQRRSIVAVVAVLVLAAVVLPFMRPIWVVQVDGQTIGYTRNKNGILKLANDILEADGTLEENATTLELIRAKGKNTKLTPRPELEDRLSRALLHLQDGWIIKINGTAVVTLSTEEEAETVLEKVKTSFPPETGSEVKELYIKEEIEIVPQIVRAHTISAVDEAVALLLRGTTKQQEYEVQSGDSLWSIARVHDMYVDDIKAANPGLTENLQIGQKISLVVPKPYVTVVSREEKTVAEAIPFKTETVKDSQLYTYERKVRTEGKFGSKKTTYVMVRENGCIVEQTAIKEVVDEEPTTQIVAVGTKQPAVVATGRYTWPVSRGGQITSRFGYRSGSFHSGIDIAVPQGTPVIASDNGVVTYAGWNGGYGKCVIISHGASSTLYGHLSQIMVTHNQKVQKGQTIGLVGSTGKSTGPHLHFEVREGGSQKNPLLYFQHK
ncbi:MAG: peptidoglycan DD-metalloendopeptidase family protein [Firmicutes bacterium]|nr:peptidoglycan DD-metalloendopeptidase family protein [Bacillota bacterium]